MTLRPFGPSVIFTALARMSTPRSMRSRASVENLTSLAAMVFGTFCYIHIPEPVSGRFLGGCPSRYLALDHPHDVGFLHDQIFDTVKLDFGARPLAEQHHIANFHIDRNQLAGLITSTGTNSDDFA